MYNRVIIGMFHPPIFLVLQVFRAPNSFRHRKLFCSFTKRGTGSFRSLRSLSASSSRLLSFQSPHFRFVAPASGRGTSKRSEDLFDHQISLKGAATRCSLTLSSKVNLRHVIKFRAKCSANLATQHLKIEGERDLRTLPRGRDQNVSGSSP